MGKRNKFIVLLMSASFCFSVLLVNGSACADSNDEKAKAAFKKGSKLFENKQYSAAAIQFRIAYKYKPTWKLFYNIGQCEAGAKHYGQALEAFERYMVEAGDDISDDRREEMRKETTRMRELVGMLQVDGPKGAEIFIDGIKRGELPLSGVLPVTATIEHTLSGVYNGKKLSVEKVKLMSGQVLEVTLEETEEVAIPVAAASDNKTEEVKEVAEENSDEENAVTSNSDAESNDESNDDSNADSNDESEKEVYVSSSQNDLGSNKYRILKIAGIASIGVGAAALIGGGVTGLIALNKEKEIKDACLDGYDGCVIYDNMDQTVSSRDTLGRLSTVFFAAGGAIATAGVVLLVIGIKKGKTEKVSKRLTILPVAAANGGGAILGWRF